MTMGDDGVEKLSFAVQNDLRVLCLEAKKRHGIVREACEDAIAKVRSASGTSDPLIALTEAALPAALLATESRDPKVVKLGLHAVQRLITGRGLETRGAALVLTALSSLLEAGLEEIKVLQTLTLLLTTNDVVGGELLAKALVLCVRLAASKDSTTAHAAGATVRQLTALVFERVPRGTGPLGAAGKDALALLSDLVILVNGEPPHWLVGIREVGRAFALELLETLLARFPFVFGQWEEFAVVLKERLCAMLIKLFSPSAKVKAEAGERAGYATAVRLLRIVDILLGKYHGLLATESEIFLSLLVRLLGPEKPSWQRGLALELLHRLVAAPRLLATFCRAYDLRPHATDVCKDMVNALGAYVQSVFANPGAAFGGQGDSIPTAFYFRGSSIPLIQRFAPSTPRPQLTELTDKAEPPAYAINEGYGLSLAYACLSDFVLSLAQLDRGVQQGNIEDSDVLRQLLTSAWPGLLSALSLLLEASVEEVLTESICEKIVTLAILSGRAGLTNCREAMVLALCAATLPPLYGYAVLKSTVGASAPHPEPPPNSEEAKHTVVVVGTSVVPSLAIPPSLSSTPVMLSKKNLLVTGAVVSLSLEAGGLLGSSWLTVLTTLQHLCWVTGVHTSPPKQTTDGSRPDPEKPLKAPNGGIGVVGALVDFVSYLGNGTTALIERTSGLDDVSLHHVINALTTLSQEAMEIAYTNREPSLFAVGKLLETGLANLDRVEIYWRPLTSHLLEICRHPHMRLRESGADALTFLVRAGLGSCGEGRALVLGPLCELSAVGHNDVRRAQLIALSSILHTHGDRLGSSWPLAFDVLAGLATHHSEGLVRAAFQCLQLVVTDFLPALPAACLPRAIDTTAKFGKQKQDLNVALSGIGLMWNIADFLYQNRPKILENLTVDIAVFPDFPGVPEIPQFDRLWLGIYQKLGELCVDERPAVRKSGGQTLFSTLSAHSGVLCALSWEAVLWRVLFPLLEGVEAAWKAASSEKVDTRNALLIHHSRNTEQKQWAETEVLVLSGVAKLLALKRSALAGIEEFPKAWGLFLHFIQAAASSPNEEVSLAGLKSFAEALADDPQPDDTWEKSWKVYSDIGQGILTASAPHQQFLTAYVSLFHRLFPAVKHALVVGDLENLNNVFSKSLSVPLTADGASSIIFQTIDSGVSPLQDQIYASYDSIIKESVETTSLKPLLPPLFIQLIQFGASAVGTGGSGKGIPLEGVVPHSVEFGVKCLHLAVRLLTWVPQELVAHDQNVFSCAMENFRPILAARFGNPEGAWRDCSSEFFTAVPILVGHGTRGDEFWTSLASCASEFLFCAHGEWVSRKGWKDEEADVRMVRLLKDLIFSNDGSLPSHFLIAVVKIFHRGSCINEYDGISVCEREEFVRFCFSSLLEFVLKGPTSVSELVELQGGEEGKKMAVLALLQRFQNILLNYRDYVGLNSHIPIQRYGPRQFPLLLSRHRLAEMNFVLRAIASLLENLKTADPARVAAGTWEHIVAIYPDLVGIVGLPGVEASVGIALRDALLAYRDLLSRPATAT